MIVPPQSKLTSACVAPAGNWIRVRLMSIFVGSPGGFVDGSVMVSSETGKPDVLVAVTRPETSEFWPSTACPSAVVAVGVGEEGLADRHGRLRGQDRVVVAGRALRSPARPRRPCAAGIAQLSTSRGVVGRSGSPVLRKVSRSTVAIWTVPPFGLDRQRRVRGVGEDEAQPGDVGGGDAAGQGQGRPGLRRRCWYSRRPGTPRAGRAGVTVTRSAPGGKVTGPMPVTVNRSNTSGVESSTPSEVTWAVVDEPFRTPRVIVLASLLPATAPPSAQVLVATGCTTRGTST